MLTYVHYFAQIELLRIQTFQGVILFIVLIILYICNNVVVNSPFNDNFVYALYRKAFVYLVKVRRSIFINAPANLR